MDITAFYEKGAARRVSLTLGLLVRHNVSRWALSGGLAIELHLCQRGAQPLVRPLHDLDFIAPSFDCLPSSLGDSVISRHVHPYDAPGKTMLQAVDPNTSVRIDVFRAYGSEMDRAQKIEVLQFEFHIVAFEDLVTRHARLCCDLLRGQTIAPKYARDFLRMLGVVNPGHIENIWQEHRKRDTPESFGEAVTSLRKAIAERTDLLIPPVYSTDVDEVCPRCESTPGFRLADARQVLGLLGYC
jgi:hypothetical protein